MYFKYQKFVINKNKNNMNNNDLKEIIKIINDINDEEIEDKNESFIVDGTSEKEINM